MPSDVEILAELVERTPDEYRFGWGSQKRFAYAARILLRMLLFEPLAVERAVFVRSEDSTACSYLVKYENGSTRILTAGPQGSLIVLFQADAPAGWAAEPGNWLR